jgi:hypothetical protein
VQEDTVKILHVISPPFVLWPKSIVFIRLIKNFSGGFDMYLIIIDARSEEKKKRHQKIFAQIGTIAAVTACWSIGSPAMALAYKKGEVAVKAQPIIDLLKDVAEPVAYGCYVYAFIRYMLGQEAEAKRMLRGTTWALLGINLLPWLFNIIKSIGDQ